MRLALVSAATSLLFGCQNMLGFEPFVRDRLADGGDPLHADGAPSRAEAGSAPPSDGAPFPRGSGGTTSMTSGGTAGYASRGTGGRGAATTMTGGAVNGGRSNGGAGAPMAGGGASPGGLTGIAGNGCHSHCGGGASWLDAVSCEGADRCGGDAPQCNPTSGTCFHLDVDHDEVTMKDYLAWVATNPEWPAPPEECAWKGSDFAPDSRCLAAVASDLHCTFSPLSTCAVDAGCTADAASPSCATFTVPVVCVDWCDAYAYCAAHGKRLCGSLRGGAVPMTLAADPGESQWMNACSAGGQFSYASGDDVPPLGGCSHGGTQTLYEVGTVPGCRSPSPGYSRFHDMSGNAAEWEDACEPVNDSAPGKDDPCATRGGSYSSAASALECGQIGKMPRNETRYDVGFRCCGLP